MIDSIIREIEADSLGITIFSPDCLRAGIAAPIIDYIHEATGLKPNKAFYISHTKISIREFYKKSGIPEARFQDMDNLFLSDKSLAVCFHGADAFLKLNKLKGMSHPARCHVEEIRGKFWCDSKVFNLIHVPDNKKEAVREIRVVAKDIVLFSNYSICLNGLLCGRRYSHSGLLNIFNLVGSDEYEKALRVVNLNVSPVDKYKKLMVLLRNSDIESLSMRDFIHAISRFDGREAKFHLNYIDNLDPFKFSAISAFLDGLDQWGLGQAIPDTE